MNIVLEQTVKSFSLRVVHKVIDAALFVTSDPAHQGIAGGIDLKLLFRIHYFCRVGNVAPQDRTHFTLKQSYVPSDTLAEVPIDWIRQRSLKLVSFNSNILSCHLAQ